MWFSLSASPSFCFPPVVTSWTCFGIIMYVSLQRFLFTVSSVLIGCCRRTFIVWSVVSFPRVQCLCLVTHRLLVRVLVHIFLPVSLVFQLYNGRAVYGHAQVQDMHMSSASVRFRLLGTWFCFLSLLGDVTVCPYVSTLDLDLFVGVSHPLVWFA